MAFDAIRQVLGGVGRRTEVDDILTDPVEPEEADLTSVRPTYVEPEQQTMLDALKETDYCALAKAVHRAEHTKAPDPKNSRIDIFDKWSTNGITLLAQRIPIVIQCVLDNTLPQRALLDLKDQIRRPSAMATWQGKAVYPIVDALHRSDTPNARSLKKDHADIISVCKLGSLDPVIYINYLADKNGQGLTCDEFEKFLGAFEVAAGLEPDSLAFDVAGVSVTDGINTEFSKGKSRPTAFFSNLNNEESMTNGVRDFVEHYREHVLPAARDQEIDHITFKGEVGWSIKGYERCEAHRKLTDSSPDIFRLAQLVVRHLYPRKGFQLHQLYLFDVVDEEQAAIGESIGSQLAASYAKYGGFNRKQAGLSVTEAWRITNVQMRDLRTKAVEKYLTNVEPNLDAAAKLYQSRLTQAEAAKRNATGVLAMVEAEREFKKAEKYLNLVCDTTEATVEISEREIDELQEAIDRQVEENERLEAADRALRQVAVDLGLIIPSSHSTGQ